MSTIASLQAEYPQRIARARTLMAEQGLDALVLFTGPNLVYFTGMPCGRSGSRPFIYILPLRGAPALIVHEGRQFEARTLTPVRDVRTYTRLSHLPLDLLLAVLTEHHLGQGCIGVELGGEMVLDLPFGEFLALREAAPHARFVDASSLLWQLRMVKSAAESARVRQACAITSDAYTRTFAAIRPGMSEAEIEAIMLSNMLMLGGRSPWVLLTSGAGNYDLVSKGSSSRSVEPGDMIWMDCGCSIDGYCSDFSRAGVIGGPSHIQADAQRQIHAITRMGVDLCRPGVRVAEIAAQCNAAVVALGLPITSNISALAGRVGHGLGMLFTELPSLCEADSTRLAAGMVVTIEPGVATDFGTFHVEENVLVTLDGPEVLSAADRQLWAI